MKGGVGVLKVNGGFAKLVHVSSLICEGDTVEMKLCMKMFFADNESKLTIIRLLEDSGFNQSVDDEDVMYRVIEVSPLGGAS